MRFNLGKWRELWSALPKHGWPVSAAMRFLKDPPTWFVVCSGVFGLFVVARAVYLIGFGSADEVNKFVVGVAAFAGAPFLIWRTWIADRQRHISQEELYTSLLTKAVEQLGATREEKTEEGKVKTVPNIEVRLGAIYALEKLARDYLALHWQIMEILCAYVRENAKPSNRRSVEMKKLYEEPIGNDQNEAFSEAPRSGLKTSTDVQVALTVIGRRSNQQREFELQNLIGEVVLGYDRLDLRDCYLVGVNLCGLNFARADFSGACLKAANLFGASLEQAYFLCAHLEDADLSKADLYQTNFGHAFLQSTRIQDAFVDNADFSGAILLRVRLRMSFNARSFAR